jgi:hypothetical protein
MPEFKPGFKRNVSRSSGSIKLIFWAMGSRMVKVRRLASMCQSYS